MAVVIYVIFLYFGIDYNLMIACNVILSSTQHDCYKCICLFIELLFNGAKVIRSCFRQLTPEEEVSEEKVKYLS